MKPYMPSNGTEGCDFEYRWCNHCLKMPVNPDKGGCEIFLNALCGKQPKQWVYGEDGKSICTAFKSRKI